MKIQNILLILAAIFLVILYFSSKSVKEYFVIANTNPLTEKKDFIDQSLINNVIPNAPPPPGTDQTGKLIYTSADLQANIEDVKKKYDLLNFNIPNYIKQEVNQQVVAICQRQPNTEYGPQTAYVQ